jgi:mannose-6-phosphate isomerase-like protein (cupin superfamily)
MHVAPADLRLLRREDVLLRFAVLGDIAYVQVELPPGGSTGTFLEQACERPHWAFVVSGSVEVETEASTVEIPGGRAFHVPEGLSHRLHAPGRTRIAGFERIDPHSDLSDDSLRAEGYEVVRGNGLTRPGVPGGDPGRRVPDVGEIATAGTQMGDLLFCQTRFGPRSGFASPFCDLEHWGLVTAGSIAIEWEDDVEVLTAGDIFRCEAGPPGHRFTAADPAGTVDFTPLVAFHGSGRVVDWRQDLAAQLRSARRPRRRRVEVAALR